MQKNITSILQGLGLDDANTKVYLALSSLGPSTVLDVARASGVKRTSIYHVLDNLTDLGLARIELKGFKKLYAAENPERLEGLLDHKLKELKNALPDLLSIYNKKNNPSTIRIYEGLAAVESAYEELLRDLTSDDFYAAIGSDANEWFNLDPKFFGKFLEKRTRLQVPTQLLLKNTLKNNNFKKQKSHFYQKIKILKETSVISTSIEITPTKVLLLQISEPIFATLISNENLARNHKELFDAIWDATPEIL